MGEISLVLDSYKLIGGSIEKVMYTGCGYIIKIDLAYASEKLEDPSVSVNFVSLDHNNPDITLAIKADFVSYKKSWTSENVEQTIEGIKRGNRVALYVKDNLDKLVSDARAKAVNGRYTSPEELERQERLRAYNEQNNS